MGNENKFDKYIKLLETNKNLILTGAPGTGKTYLAKAIAEAMSAEYEFIQFHPSYDYTDFVEGLRPTPPDTNGNIGFKRVDGVFKEFCKKILSKISTNPAPTKHIKTTHDVKNNDIKIKMAIGWIMTQNGINVESIGKRTTYTLVIDEDKILLQTSNNKPHRVNLKSLKRYLETESYNKQHETYAPTVGKYIKEHCPLYNNDNAHISSSKNDSKKEFNNEKRSCPYLFIIDEINRGEISKIFGELFFSIDPGYRGEKGRVKTQYQNMITDETDPFFNGFYVPENVYIIGTMNDIDRSVESMDFAMRRRFAWEEVKANENTGMLDNLQDMKAEVIETMTRLNLAIWDEEKNTGIEGLSPAYHIGGAYFSKLSLYLDESHSNKADAYKQLWDNHLKGVLFEYLRGMPNAIADLKELERVYFNEQSNDNIEG